MKNALKSEIFNRFDSTKDRSPRFRAFVIILLLVVSCFLVYVGLFKKDVTGTNTIVAPDRGNNVGLVEQQLNK